MARLTVDQAEILCSVESGHNNVFITGQAGTGKSFLVKEIYRRLTSKGLRVSIICSSGIAGTVYEDLGAKVSTVHSYYGLRTADLPWNLVVDRSTSDNLLRERLRNVHCIIWDEASMSSKRILEIVNHIHHVVEPAESESLKPFSGKQVIVVGEFLQLRPVPNYFDEGNLMFESEVFKNAFPHRYELKSIMRQDKKEREFLDCLNEVRFGKCSEKSKEFIEFNLSRDLTEQLEKNAVHIYFKKISAQVHNMNVLRCMPGEVVKLEADDKGDTKGIQCPAEKVILLKPGCKVMLLWNKSERLRNGTAGTFIEKLGDSKIIVEFPKDGKVTLKKEIWHKRSRNGDAVGSREQFPVGLMYAVTCHKTQGLTLPAAVVHCSKEFVPGLIYVSLSRVRSCSHLQVLGFRPNQLISPSPGCVNVCDTHTELIGDLSCCRNNLLSQDMLVVSDSIYDDPGHQDVTFHPEEVSEGTKKVIKSYFERGDPQEQIIDLETVYLIVSDEKNSDVLRIPPENFNVKSTLEEMKVSDPLSEFAKNKNEQLDMLIGVNDQTEVFGKVLWSRASQIILEDCINNINELQISTQQWSIDTKELFSLITKSPFYMRDLQLFYGTEHLSKVQTAIGAEMMVAVYKEVVATIVAKAKQEEENASVTFNVREMPTEGLAKIRYTQ